MITLYGIKNCDSVKKTIKHFEENDTAYTFIDLKTTILSEELLSQWLQHCPDTLVNKRSTTYRAIKNEWVAATDTKSQIALLQQHQTVIKRPVCIYENGDITIGVVDAK